MTPNPKWLEILKDAEIPLPVAAACSLFLLAARRGWFLPLADWMIQLAWIGLVATPEIVFLCVMGIGGEA